MKFVTVMGFTVISITEKRVSAIHSVTSEQNYNIIKSFMFAARAKRGDNNIFGSLFVRRLPNWAKVPQRHGSEIGLFGNSHFWQQSFLRWQSQSVLLGLSTFYFF